MQWYETEVRTLEEQRTSGCFPQHSPVFYGSSSIRQWTALAVDIGPGALNLGFGGSTLDACDYFFDRLISPLEPSSLTLYAGDNDLGDGRAPEQVVASFCSLAAKVERLPGSPPFGFISIKPSPARWPIVERIRSANRSIAVEIQRRSGAYYIDVFAAMLGPKGQPRPELFEADGLHMNRAGYRLWTELLRPYKNRIFSACSRDSNKKPVSFVQCESRVSQVVQPEFEP